MFSCFVILAGDSAVNNSHTALAQKAGEKVVAKALAQGRVLGDNGFALELVEESDLLFFLLFQLLSNLFRDY